MRGSIEGFSLVLLVALLTLGCGKKEEKGSADKSAEAQKLIQEGIEKERKMIEGMAKGLEGLEKGVQERKEKEKK